MGTGVRPQVKNPVKGINEEPGEGTHRAGDGEAEEAGVKAWVKEHVIGSGEGAAEGKRIGNRRVR